MSKQREVNFGLEAELPILRGWARVSPYARGVARWTKSTQYADYDFIGWSKDGIPFVFVEVKERRSCWGDYDDVIFPRRKHRFARRLSHFNIALLGVTRYSCGTLVEVNLQDEPDEQRLITRRDRPNSPVWHVIYPLDALTVFRPEVP